MIPREKGQTRIKKHFLVFKKDKQGYGKIQYLLSDFSLRFTIKTSRLYSDEDAYIQFLKDFIVRNNSLCLNR